MLKPQLYPATSPYAQDPELFVLPFDHRGSFQEKLFGVRGVPDAEQLSAIIDAKQVIFEGFLTAINRGIPIEKTAILVDEQFGLKILKEARTRGFRIACPVEKSGQEEFDFEYGTEFEEHIDQIQPDYVKVLVRYNPEASPELNQRQAQRLRHLSQVLQSKPQMRFMFELLVPATPKQLAQGAHTTNTASHYDSQLRPSLTVQAIAQLQESGVEPDVWKLEGIGTASDSQRVAEQTRSGGRKGVGVIVLGRGENREKVSQWLQTAAQTPGVVGFAVGRTIFWEPLVSLKEGRINRDAAISQIADRYEYFCNLWQQARSATA